MVNAIRRLICKRHLVVQLIVVLWVGKNSDWKDESKTGLSACGLKRPYNGFCLFPSNDQYVLEVSDSVVK